MDIISDGTEELTQESGIPARSQRQLQEQESKKEKSSTINYPHLVPRVDPEYYQAEIPSIYLNQTNVKDKLETCFNASQRINTTDQRFLSFINEMLYNKVVYNPEDTYTYPHSNFELDELASTFLTNHESSLEKAYTAFATSLSCGKDSYHLSLLEKKVNSLPSSSINEKFDAIFHFEYCFGRIHSENAKKAGDFLLSESFEISGEESLKSRSKLADKQDTKKRWIAVGKSTQLMLNASKSSRASRPTYFDLLGHLKSIKEALPFPNPTILCDDSLSTVQQSLNKLIQVYLSCKNWISSLNDYFYSQEDISQESLKKLIAKSSELPIRCIAEEILLKQTLEKMENIFSEGHTLIQKIKNFEDSVSLIQRKKLTKIQLEDAYMKLTKVSFSQLSAFLLKLDHPMFKSYRETNLLNSHYKNAEDIIRDIDDVLNRELMCSDKKGARISKVPFNVLEQLNWRIVVCPIDVETVQINEMLRFCLRWKDGVCELLGDGKQTISLKKIEALIHEGDSIPVEFPQEMEILKEKRGQAKSWLDKLKKTINKTASRSTRLSGGENTFIEKVGFQDIKKMVEEGELLFDDTRNKELVMAMSLIDTAENWMERVSDLLQSDDVNDIEILKELLAETETMPVALEEAQILKLHIEAVEWAQRIGSTFERGPCKLATLQRYYKDISRIRSEISKFPNGKNTCKLKEEILLEGFISVSEKWISGVKILMQGTVLKPGVTLHALQNILLDLKEIHVDLDYEARYLREVVLNAENWLIEHYHVLKRLGVPIVSIEMPLDDSQASYNQSEKIPFEVLEAMYSKSESITILFPELTSMRNLYTESLQWHDRVEAIFSSSIKKHKITMSNLTSNYPRCTIEYLEELVSEGEALKVNVQTVTADIQTAIMKSKNWDMIIQPAVEELHNKVASSVTCFQELLRTMCLKTFPCFTGIENDVQSFLERFIHKNDRNILLLLDNSVQCNNAFDEKQLWNAIEVDLIPFSLDLMRQHREIEVCTPQAKYVIGVALSLKWISEVRCLILSDSWGDCDMLTIYNLLDDIKHLWSFIRPQDNMSLYFENTILSDRNIHLSDFNNLEISGLHSFESDDLERNVESLSQVKTRRREPKNWKGKREDAIIETESSRDEVKRSRRSFENEDHLHHSKKKRSISKTEQTPKKAKSETDSIADDDSLVIRESLFTNQSLQYLSISRPTVYLLETWSRILQLFLKRRMEYKLWLNIAQITFVPRTKVLRGNTNNSKSIDWESIVLKNEQQEDVEVLMSWALSRHLDGWNVRLLRERINFSKKWDDDAIHYISNTNKIKMEDMYTFIRNGEKLIFPKYELISQLKDLVKKAKSWISKFPRNPSEASAQNNIQLMVEEAASFAIDVSEYTGSILQATELYCLCRQPSGGFMIGCDSCDDWIHGQCVGLTKLQADKCDNYKCLRCLLKVSFSGACEQAASLVCSWMSPDSACKIAEVKRAKVSKRREKEERDLKSLLKELDSLCRIQLLSTNEAETQAQDNQITGPLSQLNFKIDALNGEIEQCKERLAKIQIEESLHTKLFSLDTAGKSSVFDWMLQVRTLLWPLNANEIEMGEPQINKLPSGLESLLATASENNILDVYDVRHCIDIFKWMKWCYKILHVLRGPPTTVILKNLLNEIKSLSYIDEKITKILNGILSRASSWKMKSRRVLQNSGIVKQSDGTQYLKVDISKLKSVVDDGIYIPIRTKIKEITKRALDSVDVSNSSSSLGESSSRRSLKNAFKVQGGYVIMPEIPCSSDEEENPDSDTMSIFPTDMMHKLYPPPSELWPPLLKEARPEPYRNNLQIGMNRLNTPISSTIGRSGYPSGFGSKTVPSTLSSGNSMMKRLAMQQMSSNSFYSKPPLPSRYEMPSFQRFNVNHSSADLQSESKRDTVDSGHSMT